MDEGEVRLQRATSVRLRRRRDQARREFLNNRRSGDFGYNTEAAGAGEVDDGWDFQSFVSPSAAADRGGVFSDTELGPHSGGRKPRSRQSRRVRREARPGHGDAELGVKFTDFGFIDRGVEKVFEDKSRVEPVYEYPHPATRPQPRSTHLRRSQEISNQLLSLPVTISEYNQCRESVHLQKGGLWLKRDKFFSKWRERFFVITSTHLKCFESDSESILLWKIEISEVTEVQLHDKKGYLTLSISFRRDGRIMLRSTSGIDKWFSLIKALAERGAAPEQQGTKEFWSGRQDVHGVDSWLLDRQFLDRRPRGRVADHHYAPPPERPPRYHHPPRYQPPPDHRPPAQPRQQPRQQPRHPPPQFQSLHDVWPLTEQPQPVTRNPPHRSSNRRIRPKSCIELSDNKLHYKGQNIRSEDSGNSSMSTSTPRSSRK